MNSDNQQKVINFLLANETATARQIAKLLERESKPAWHIIMNMVRRERLERCGTGKNAAFRLAQGWEGKICRPKATARKSAKPVTPEACHHDWNSHHIHQVFGSTRRAQG